jgi:multidrug efflux system outer membrane protein
MTRFAILTLVAALSLGGCASFVPKAPAYQDKLALPVPDTLGPTAVSGVRGADGGAVALDWHVVVTDPRLRSLVDLALANNRDLRLAALNIDAARAQYRITDAALLPTVKASAGGTAARTSAATSGGGSGTSRTVSASLGIAAWEIDIWGRLRELKSSALSTYLASEQTRTSVQASLVTEVAQAWFTLAADLRLADLAAATMVSNQESLALAQRRHELGSATALDVATAEATYQTARGDLAASRAQLKQDHNALRLLVGAEPPAETLPGLDDAAHAAELPAVPSNLPSTVLLQRPDLRAAELLLQASRANVQAARAALFPTLSLTSSLGQASTGLNGLWSAANRTWSIAPSLSLPILDGGATQAALDSAQVNQRIQLATYEKAIQTAFQEVSDALAVRDSLTERLTAQRAQVQAYADTLRLTQRQRELGAASAVDVLTAQRSLYSAQQSLISLQLTEQANRLTLFKVLGGA